MKGIFILLLGLTLNAEAAQVVGAKLDASKKNILVDVIYAGGCKIHTFSLLPDLRCLGSHPLQCNARLMEEIEGGSDTCEAIIHDTAVIGLAEAGLDNPYYQGATLTIRGARSFTGKDTSASVELP